MIKQQSHYQRNQLKSEIRFNLRELKWRLIFTGNLLNKLIFKSGLRTQKSYLKDCENCWDNYWAKGDIFNPEKSYLYTQNGMPFSPRISGYEFQRDYLIPVIARFIRNNNCKRVLDIGSGSGTNLLLLAHQFPEVEFIGLEPTASGIQATKAAIQSPPKAFIEADAISKIKNITLLKGSILDKNIQQTLNQSYDLVMTVGVLVILYNSLNIALDNIFKLDFKYFCFFEEWLDINNIAGSYWHLLKNDYFRTSWKILNQYPSHLIETIVPGVQPSGSNFAFTFGKKLV